MVEQKRESFRVEFPRSYYPTVTLRGKTYDIFDASEFGIKFYSVSNAGFALKDEFTTIIIFPDKEEYMLKARVVRVEKKFISLELLEPIPLCKIRSEHIHLMQMFSEKASSI